MRCNRCFRGCSLSKGQVGLCQAVSFDGERIVLDGPSISTLSVGPIEEKAIYHYRPGTNVFTIGFYGCNLRCSFCINHKISQERGQQTFVPSAALVSRAISENATGIAFSFSEPLLYAEFVKTTFKMAHDNGLYTALKTSGMMSKDLFESVLEETDVVSIDVKGSPEEYLACCNVSSKDLDILFQNMEYAKCASNLEVSMIVRHNDHKRVRSSLPEISGAAGPLTPIHLVSFLPSFKDDSPPAVLEDMQMAHGEATIYFEYVYDENPNSETVCRSCWGRLVKRIPGAVAYNGNGNSCWCGQQFWKNACDTTTNAKNAKPSLK